MGKYQNKNGHLPSAPNRQWYEADIKEKETVKGLYGQTMDLFL